MTWFDRWFFRKWQWAWENRDSAEPALRSSTAINKLAGQGIIEEDVTPWNDGLRIGIKKMIGGYVVSFRIYDRYEIGQKIAPTSSRTSRISTLNWARL